MASKDEREFDSGLTGGHGCPGVGGGLLPGGDPGGIRRRPGAAAYGGRGAGGPPGDGAGRPSGGGRREEAASANGGAAASRPPGDGKNSSAPKAARQPEDLLEELRQKAFDPYQAFTVAEVFNMREEELKEFVGENGHFSTMFDLLCSSADGRGTRLVRRKAGQILRMEEDRNRIPAGGSERGLSGQYHRKSR